MRIRRPYVHVLFASLALGAQPWHSKYGGDDVRQQAERQSKTSSTALVRRVSGGLGARAGRGHRAGSLTRDRTRFAPEIAP
eukprot:5355566-Prymnesium_polylepis.2